MHLGKDTKNRDSRMRPVQNQRRSQITRLSASNKRGGLGAGDLQPEGGGTAKGGVGLSLLPLLGAFFWGEQNGRNMQVKALVVSIT